MSAKVEGLPGILRTVKRMGMKLAQATTSASSLVVLMVGAPESLPPELTFPLGPQRATRVSPNVALPRSVSKDWRRDLSSPCPFWKDRWDMEMAIGGGDKIRAELMSARCY